jgi:hypothetical protein
LLRIRDTDAVENLLELRVKTHTRAAAVRAAAKWKDKAPMVYESIYNMMFEEEST